MSPRPQPPQQPPPVQRLRVRYAKRGRARFASHRDIGRALERALRRAGIPMAFSSGFSPHPRISYAGASPTGAGSESEYLELGLARPVDPIWAARTLNAALPTGIEVVAIAADPADQLSDLLQASHWRIDLPEVPQEVAEQAVAALLAAQTHLVERMTKSGLRSFDVRAAVQGIRVCGPGVVEVLSVIGTPLVRPDDVLSALISLVPQVAPKHPAVFHRLAQGRLIDGVVVDPLDVSGPSLAAGVE